MRLFPRREEIDFRLQRVGTRLSDLVPTKEEIEATAALQRETAALLERPPEGLASLLPEAIP